MTADLSVPAPQPNPSTWKPHTRCARCGSGATLLVNSTPYCGCCRASGDRVVVGTASVVSSSRAVDLDLDQIEARANAATAGPWDQNGANGVHRGHACVALTYTENRQNRKSDAEFIAHTREDVPALVAEVRRLRKASEDWPPWCEHCGARCDGQHYVARLARAEAERDAARAEAEELRRRYRTVCDYAEQHDATRAMLNEAVAGAARVREALQAIRELHHPDGDNWCQSDCDDYPCATVRALGDVS